MAATLASRCPLAALPLLGPLFAALRPGRADSDAGDIAGALRAAGTWYYQIDDRHIIQEVFPVSAMVRAILIGRDIRSFVDPLGPLNEHPRMARAFQAREPFRDLILPFDLGKGRRLLRVSGQPIHDRRGRFTGYRGLAFDASAFGARPDSTVALIAPDLQRALTNALGVAMGFAQFLHADAAPDSTQAEYATLVLTALGAARDIVAASRRPPDAPCAETPASEGRASWLLPCAGASRQLARCGRVLLVQEAAEIADLQAIAFERAGFEAAVCRNGTEAIEILDEHPDLWDVLVTTAAGSPPGGAALIRHARTCKPRLLCVVCDEPAAAALAEVEADLSWPTPTEALALATTVKAALAHLAG
jgi:hypothetical protein